MNFVPLLHPEYPLDLTHAPDKIWGAVIEAERDAARRLGEAGWHSIAREAAAATRLSHHRMWRIARGLSHPFAWMYRASGGRHLGEVRAWADGIGMHSSHLLLLQCLYELSHLGAPMRTFGCSAGVTELPDGRLVHARNLDWDLPEIADATRIFRCRTARGHEARIVGMVGQVSVLSAMVPGGYSVTLNWAPPAALPMFFLGPLFALRELVNSAAHFHEAVNFLKTRRFASSVFFTVCGAKPGEGCVIEYVKQGFLSSRRECRLRILGGGPLVQTNHYQNPDLERFNPTDPPGDLSMLEATSRLRREVLAKGLAALRTHATLDEVKGCLDVPPVHNDETCQKMVFCPATGEMKVWVREHARLQKSA